jgi:Kef-type K+ transport system membrane component KefB
MLLTAKLGGELAIRVKQPAVVGELIAGIILGNLSFGGAALFDGLARNETIEDAAGAQMES